MATMDGTCFPKGMGLGRARVAHHHLDLHLGRTKMEGPELDSQILQLEGCEASSRVHWEDQASPTPQEPENFTSNAGSGLGPLPAEEDWGKMVVPAGTLRTQK